MTKRPILPVRHLQPLCSRHTTTGSWKSAALSTAAMTSVIGRLPAAPVTLRSGGMAAHTLYPPSDRQRSGHEICGGLHKLQSSDKPEHLSLCRCAHESNEHTLLEYVAPSSDLTLVAAYPGGSYPILSALEQQVLKRTTS